MAAPGNSVTKAFGTCPRTASAIPIATTRLIDRGMLYERFFDRARVNFEPVANDDVFDPVDEEKVAILIEIADIAGSQGAFDKGGLRLLEVAPNSRP